MRNFFFKKLENYKKIFIKTTAVLILSLETVAIKNEESPLKRLPKTTLGLSILHHLELRASIIH